MANRSYVYSVDTRPEPGKQPSPIRSLSEFNWDIPLAHKILASQAPSRCQSVIWEEHRIGVVADYAGGVERLLKFLDAVGVKDKAFEDAVAETRQVLDKHRGKYLLVEAGEIYDLSGNDLADECERLLAELPLVAKRVDGAIAGAEKDWLAEVAAEWEEKLGLYWADVLYFDFGV
jgi:hypothetical protein